MKTHQPESSILVSGAWNRPCQGVAFFLVMFLMIGCSRKGPITGPPAGGFDLNDYLPVEVNNSWTFDGFATNTARGSDTSWSSPTILSIFQANVLVGGKPNAFIVRMDDNEAKVSYLAFSIDGKTLLHYLGAGSTIPPADNFIIWVSGGVEGAVVGADQTQKFHIADQSGNSIFVSILRSPDPTIARAIMISPDTMLITGVSVGQTTLTLHEAGGSESDTMAVLIATVSNLPSSVASPYPPWIPIWQLTNSSSEQTIFSEDTTYIFKCITDSAECRDELHYLSTNLFVGSESVPALNTTIACDRFQMKMTISETVTLTDKSQSRILFSGLSTQYTIDTWLAKGIGFVRATVNGNSRSPLVIMGGLQDANGVLDGYYLSPRVTYAATPQSLNYSSELFHVDDTPLAASPVYNGFVLFQKNF